MKRFGTRSATGKMVKLKLPVDVESLLIEASNRSGRSRSFEAVIRLKDHLHRYRPLTGCGDGGLLLSSHIIWQAFPGMRGISCLPLQWRHRC